MIQSINVIGLTFIGLVGLLVSLGFTSLVGLLGLGTKKRKNN